MKAIATIVFIIFISFSAQAQENNLEAKVVAQTETVALANEVITTTLNSNDTKVARLYMDRNYKVKKELSFKTKKNKSKLA
ncbi:hypothetical protein H0I23_02670 [Cellulophaga sp. HaHaR_3_176]|uniref:hypothetical protein n=1 Tax=Cellulophaga sp. HaHaR_3_176 TaxID=1942464 RepID=UPI001C1F8FDC|nr:hypothetical protein [Cellulophaga sp. HaHaR_3_176]QWX84567.1 hypothetical protein H0I23_02670 [Cellulophaga sp. HaHaR_3_176]